MLTWMGFVGKLIDFILNKIVGKKLDLALDEKKRAAKSFFQFHESVAELETLLDRFIAYIESFIEGRNSKIYRVHLEGHIRDLQSSTSVFVNNLKEFGKALYFYDVKLATLFTYVGDSKGNLFRNIYMLFEDSLSDEHDGPVKFKSTVVNKFYSPIKCTIPNDELMDANLDEKFNKFDLNCDTFDLKFLAQQEFLADFNIFHSLFGHGKMSRLREYQDIFLDAIVNNVEEINIGYKEKDKLIVLYPRLKSHRELLDKSRERLREFIQQQFSLADLLHVVRK